MRTVDFLLPADEYYPELTKKNTIYLHHTAGGHRPDFSINGWDKDALPDGRSLHVATSYVIGGKSTTDGNTDYDGIVYKVSSGGAVSTLKNFGRLYAVSGMSGAFGFDLEKSSKPLPFTVSIQPSLWVQYPYNNFVLTHFSTCLSVGYHFPSFNRLVHQKAIRRGFKS